jgi:hypothetical protein
MGGAGFEPAKAMPPDLQSGPFGRLGIHPDGIAPGILALRSPEKTALILEPGRAGGGTRTHNPRFTKPMLYRLSYASGLRREIAYHIPAGGALQGFSVPRKFDPASRATASAPPARHFILANHTASASNTASALTEKS